jgi:hypothetical protein
VGTTWPWLRVLLLLKASHLQGPLGLWQVCECFLLLLLLCLFISPLFVLLCKFGCQFFPISRTWYCTLVHGQPVKFNLGELYQRVGFAKEIISRGKYAELDADQRAFRYSLLIFGYAHFPFCTD